jgi:hypothetical protein
MREPTGKDCPSTRRKHRRSAWFPAKWPSRPTRWSVECSKLRVAMIRSPRSTAPRIPAQIAVMIMSLSSHSRSSCRGHSRQGQPLVELSQSQDVHTVATMEELSPQMPRSLAEHRLELHAGDPVHPMHLLVQPGEKKYVGPISSVGIRQAGISGHTPARKAPSVPPGQGHSSLPSRSTVPRSQRPIAAGPREQCTTARWPPRATCYGPLAPSRRWSDASSSGRRASSTRSGSRYAR